MTNIDGVGLNVANSARMVSEISAQIDKISREKAKRADKIMAGAEANIMQTELLRSQLDIAKQHSILLEDNYNKLKEMYDVQLEVNRQTKIELLRARRYNIAMMIISIIAMLAAIAGPVVTMVFGE